jgi:signal transduction histidine kinase
MLHEFLANNRGELTMRCRMKVAERPRRTASPEQLQNGIPLFIEQLIVTLKVEQAKFRSDREGDTPAAHAAAKANERTKAGVAAGAAQHGHSLLALGYTVDQVVHDYGDLCQAITDLAFDRDAPFQIEEFRTLNRCLDDAIASAVAEFTHQRDSLLIERQAAAANEKVGFLAHELRNALNTAVLALSAGKAGSLNFAGATGRVLERSLFQLSELIDRAVAEVRKVPRASGEPQTFSVKDFIDEVQYAALLAAQVRGCTLRVLDVDDDIMVCGNKGLLYAALANVVQNAFKFTHAGTEVLLETRLTESMVVIEVTDHCGGIPEGEVQKIFAPFKQSSTDRSGLGLGLTIARHNVELDGGTLEVENKPGVGCCFRLSLPQHRD